MSFSSFALGDLAEINPSAPKLAANDEVSFLPMADAQEDGTVKVSEFRAYSDVKTGYTGFANDDVLIAKVTPCFENNKIVQAKLPTAFGFGSTEFHVARAGDDLDPRYLLHFLRQDWVRYAGERRMTGSGGQRRVPKQFLEQLPVPKPSLPEQRRIAAILDQADGLRRLRGQSFSRLSGLGQAIFFEMFGHPRVNRHSFPVERLSEIARFGSGGTPPKSKAEYWEGGFPWVSPKDMKALRITKAQDHVSELVFEQTSLKRVPANTVLIVVRGMILAHTVPIGMAMREVAINQDMKSLHFDPRMLPEFGLWCLLSQHDDILSAVDTAAHGTKKLNSKTLQRLPMLIPKMELQQEFALRIGVIEKILEQGRRHLAHLDEGFSSLQHRAFRGGL